MKARVSRTKHGGVLLTLEGDDVFASFHLPSRPARELLGELATVLRLPLPSEAPVNDEGEAARGR